MAKIDTRKKLLRAGVDLFYKKGYVDTTIREIGIKAGVNNSLIYHYFKNKEEMLFEICRKAVDDLIETLHAVEKDSHDPAECLRKMLVAQTAIMITKRKKESKILFEEHYWIRGEKKKLISKTQREVYDLYMKKCKELEQKGLLNDIDLTVLNFSIFGIVFWFFRWYKEGGRLSEAEVAESIWKLVFHGMLKANP